MIFYFICRVNHRFLRGSWWAAHPLLKNKRNWQYQIAFSFKKKLRNFEFRKILKIDKQIRYLQPLLEDVLLLSVQVVHQFQLRSSESMIEMF